MKHIIYIFFTLLGTNLLHAQVPTPAKAQSGAILLTNATVHIGNGEVIENGAIAFDQGKITYVGATSNADQSNHRVVDASGKHIYPGFILVNSQVGLVEVSSVRAMNDQNERGELNPNVRALIAYNTDSEIPSTFRFNGVMMAESTPQGGTISGTSSLMNMEGWNWEDAVHTADVGIHMTWPGRHKREFDFWTRSAKYTLNKTYNEEMRALDQHFADAAAYGAHSGNTNVKLAAMQGLFDGSQTLFIEAREPQEMVAGVKFAKKHGVQKIVVKGNDQAIHVADFLAQENIPVIVPPTHRLPSRYDDDYDMPFKLPHLLTEKGVTVVLSHQGMLGGGRNLPFYAGTAVAHGMSKEAALQTITLNAAKALGVEDKLGSLETGKDATLFVSEGDALDVRTNQLTHAFIQGMEVLLDNKQQMLYKRYSAKYGHDVE